jgi:hypothetical protein
MPIANCFVGKDVFERADIEGLAPLWAEGSGVGAEHMTIDVVSRSFQEGAGYEVMAFLFLPSLWAPEDVRRLQLGLASALRRAFEVPAAEVQVLTSIVESGHVVEKGEIVEWSPARPATGEGRFGAGRSG